MSHNHNRLTMHVPSGDWCIIFGNRPANWVGLASAMRCRGVDENYWALQHRGIRICTWTRCICHAMLCSWINGETVHCQWIQWTRPPTSILHVRCICIPRRIEYAEPYLELVWVSSSDLVLPPSSLHAGDAMIWFRWKVSRDALLRVCVVDPLLPGVNVLFHGCLYVLILGNAKKSWQASQSLYSWEWLSLTCTWSIVTTREMGWMRARSPPQPQIWQFSLAGKWMDIIDWKQYIVRIKN